MQKRAEHFVVQTTYRSELLILWLIEKHFLFFLYFQSFHGRPTEKKVPSRTNISVVIFLSPCSKKPVPGTTDTKTATQTPTFQVKLKGLNGGEVLEICPNFFSFDYETTLQYSARGFFFRTAITEIQNKFSRH